MILVWLNRRLKTRRTKRCRKKLYKHTMDKTKLMFRTKCFSSIQLKISTSLKKPICAP